MQELENYIDEGYDFDYIQKNLKTDLTLQDVDDILKGRIEDLQNIIRFFNRNDLKHVAFKDIFSKLEELNEQIEKLERERYYNDPVTVKHYDNLNNPPKLNEKWEINEKIYNEFLCTLPPLKYEDNGFYMSEFYKDNITAFYSRSGDAYYCEYREV